MGKQSSFTIIELLIVIAVIAILAALLLPALNKAKEKAKQVQCIGNLKQLGLATMSYHQDNDKYIFLGVSPYYWSECLAENGYIKNETLFRCPSWAPEYYHKYYTYGIHDYWDYLSDSSILNVDDKSYFLCPNRVRIPSKYFVYGDTAYGTDSSHHGYGKQCWLLPRAIFVGVGLHLRHNGMPDISFLDGHVTSYSRTQLSDLGFTSCFLPDGITQCNL